MELVPLSSVGKHSAVHRRRRQKKPVKWLYLLFFPLTCLYWEVILKLSAGIPLFGSGWFFLLIFSLLTGVALTVPCCLWHKKVNRAVAYILTGVLTVWFGIQLVYHCIFDSFMIISNLGMAGDTAQFADAAFAYILKCLFWIVLLLVPMAVLIASRRRMPFVCTPLPIAGLLAVGVVILHLLTIGILNLCNSGVPSLHSYYTDSFAVNPAIQRFGLLTSTRLELKYMIFGMPESGGYDPGFLTSSDDPDDPSGEVSGEQPVKVEYNKMNIDFDRLIAEATGDSMKDMHAYYQSQKATNKNEYTGRFAGKNLIMFTAEGFSPYAIDKELTPTLYRLYNEGFQFTNFYTPIWSVSTSDGEYVACTGLIPKGGTRSFRDSGSISMPFCLGNQFAKIGYSQPRAYHDHDYAYYQRDISHPNMGYNYIGRGTGLEVRPTWPEDDREMMMLTVDDYIDKQPFHAYYMSVSGHLLYTFGGNFQAGKNRDLVRHLDCSEGVQAYFACNIQFDRALEYLLARLEMEGILEDTVIAISPDHYPYGLVDGSDYSAFNELAAFAGIDHEIERNFELYKGVFLLWCGDMTEPVVVDKTACSADILPTLSNLFGLEYDSRLLSGSDIFSDADGLVIFNDNSWVTDIGKYNANTGAFTLNPGQTLDDQDAYVQQMCYIVKYKKYYAAKILDTDYFKVALDAVKEEESSVPADSGVSDESTETTA